MAYAPGTAWQNQYPHRDEHLPNAQSVRSRAGAVQELLRSLSPLLPDQLFSRELQAAEQRDILSAIQNLVPTLSRDNRVFATFHDGQVHDPLGGGSYAFEKDLVGPLLTALKDDEVYSLTPEDSRDPANFDGTITRPIIVHAGAQPNNSPHVGTLIVFCYAFAVAREIRGRLRTKELRSGRKMAPVSVEITFVDTAPVNGYETKIDGVQYQTAYRDVNGALATHLPDYYQVLHFLSAWADIPFITSYQHQFFSDPHMPELIRYFAESRLTLGKQLCPKYGTVALRAACPVPDCRLAEKHGVNNEYHPFINHANLDMENEGVTDWTITFYCPIHGPHFISTSDPKELARLEANAPARNLLRSMSQLLDNKRHHVRVTGADYAGMYQETFLYRPLADWAYKSTGGRGIPRTPHILYAPLVVDWSGAKLSKSLYIRKDGYQAMKLLETDALCSYAQMKEHFGDNGTLGLGRLWKEVTEWMDDPKKLFRAFSVEYLRGIILDGRRWN
ncbi:hypothetical protein N7488_002923 [Penicillium malachiteum]|nr:hypothetical protein N7488_002923 [Penicillium malachiteum]